MNTPETARPARHGAALPPPVIAYAVLTVAAATIPALVAGRAAWTSDAALLDVYRNHPAAVRLQALFAIAAAVPLAVLSAVVSDRIRALGLEVPGRLIALVGGTLAAGVLAVSGAAQVAALGASDDVITFVQRVAVALGGTVFAASGGLLAAGIAVTGLLGRILPAPVAWVGLVLAAVGELALVTVLTDAADPLLPVARFGTLIWLLVVAFTLRRRPAIQSVG